MRVEYFDDTDTLLITFSENRVVDITDMNENVLAEFDEKGNLVSLTLEHAKAQTDIETFLYKKVS